MGDPVRLVPAQRWWLLVAVAALVVGIVAWWSPRADADTPLGTTGLTGNHFLFDEASQPGAACVFDPETQTVTFTVTAPYVVGLNRDPEFVEATAVKWNAVLLQDGVAIDESALQYGSAGELSSATFAPIEIISPALPGLLSIQVDIAWIDFPEMEHETVLGTSLRQVDFYSQNLNDDTGSKMVEDGCQVAEEPTPIPSETPVPANTPIPLPQRTAEPTSTAIPESTATNIPESTSTNTPAPTATNTPEPPATSTPGPTSTPSPTATSSPTPTMTATPEPTATQTPVPTVTPAPNPTGNPPRNQPPRPRRTLHRRPTAQRRSRPTPHAASSTRISASPFPASQPIPTPRSPSLARRSRP